MVTKLNNEMLMDLEKGRTCLFGINGITNIRTDQIKQTQD